jgi:hypothetical protein
MRQQRLYGTVLLAIFVIGCGGSSPKDLIVGKWSGKQGPMEATFDFAKDGKLTVDVKLPKEIAEMMKKDTLQMEGSYKVIDDKTLEVTLKDPQSGKEKTEKGPFKVTADKLTLTNELGKEEVLTRVK